MGVTDDGDDEGSNQRSAFGPEEVQHETIFGVRNGVRSAPPPTRI
jgi:hypothetical protein